MDDPQSGGQSFFDQETLATKSPVIELNQQSHELDKIKYANTALNNKV